MGAKLPLSVFWPLSQDVRDIMVNEAYAYHRTLIGEHPEPCLMCLGRLFEVAHCESNSPYLAPPVPENCRDWSRTASLFSWAVTGIKRLLGSILR